MFKKKLRKHQIIVTAVIILMATLLTSCSLEKEDETPPTTPLLTILSVNEDSVELAWSESYDDVGVDEYRLYRNSSVLVKQNDTEYVDKDVESGEEYEYYVVAYDKAGNRSSKSVKQNVKVSGESQRRIRREHLLILRREIKDLICRRFQNQPLSYILWMIILML